MPEETGTGSADARTTAEIVLLDRRKTVIGRLRFRVCRACRTGRILEIWVLDTWQRQGLGRDLIHSLLVHLPGLRWSTTPQTRLGRAFFIAMAEETSVPFPPLGPLCTHLEGRFTRVWRGVMSRWRPASADSETRLP
ncbi:GNAT family N-acetyltransferase [Streptomyces sparsogenes]|uniref:N-acetyltransferase domain-containing protein n=1 Tax=Streptomyces sparsogenes DSM 40356 TaxID=1331668 RepID=A0A1R1SB41_9ACTN|nr:GNAT family N-acetyltransferase [Streptomyces sparsogenes]OMI35452.1 Hypothetical protein SPAR_31001 [Streptomyces sparsogenes DSM 40356]